MTTDDQLEDKNQYSTATPTKKNSFDILDASIVEKLEKMEDISPGFQSNNIKTISSIFYSNNMRNRSCYVFRF